MRGRADETAVVYNTTALQHGGCFRPEADVSSADIERTERCIGATPEHVGVDLVGADILVPHELLDRVEGSELTRWLPAGRSDCFP